MPSYHKTLHITSTCEETCQANEELTEMQEKAWQRVNFVCSSAMLVDQRLDACGLREHPSLGQSHTAQCGCENATKEKKKNPSAEAIVPGRFL